MAKITKAYRRILVAMLSLFGVSCALSLSACSDYRVPEADHIVKGKGTSPEGKPVKEISVSFSPYHH
jgi:hypothetical protein